MHTSNQQDIHSLEQDGQELLISALKDNLKMTVEQRVMAHENARQLLVELSNAGKEYRAKSQSAT